ncbi:MmgE/PrpD family protein [Kineosporia succinea]|uniref:2-methylcitrate dehydratase PrpD n=1 Tax=Kineosporia succinea TaxID=84632 RepID=A0ABT9PF37_9ACTN|nr:MmgE/PrpD family protein [Kineosporia succinea]MDP9830600.1 2-methylcitrate dehydratase PrpD [Kineosporia succinea]
MVDDVVAWRTALAGRLDSLGDGLPSGVRRRAALVLVDDLAAMVAGHAHADVASFTGAMHGSGSEATVLDGSRAARDRAAAANAVAAGWDELDEGYRPATCHGGLYAVPAALAEAEAARASLGELLTAVVAGYEVATAVARLFPAPRPLVLHPHATLAPIGAAAAVAWLRTRSGGAVLAAADVAASLSMPGPFRLATAGAQVRNLWAAAGAVSGFLAVDACHAGLTADPRTMTDVFTQGYGHQLSEDELTSRPARFAILDGYHKLYAACQYTHSALEAARDLASAPGWDADQVESIEIATHPLARPLDSTAPETALGGKFSLPHVIAAVLATGRDDAEVFSAGHLHDPQVRDLRPRVRIVPYAPLPGAPHDRPARLTVRLRDGSTRTATCLSAVGGPDRPLTENQVLAKAAGLTADAAPAFGAQARSLVEGTTADDRLWADVLGLMLDVTPGATP